MLHGFLQINIWISLGSYMYFSKLIFELMIVSLRGYTDLSKLLHGFGQKLFHGFVKILVLFFSRPLPNKTKLLKFDQDFKPSASN